MRTRALVTLLLAATLLPGCGGGEGDTLRIYTTVTQDTVDAVVDGYRAGHPGVEVEVFRAPTGEVTARIAAEQRDGGLQADVLWLSDPLSMQQYEADGLLLAWRPEGAGAIPEGLSTGTFWGTRLLTMVVVHGTDVPAPATWADLAGPEYAGGVAMPDPGFAGSALGALGWFALAEGYGFEFYEALAANGATQVPSPGDVVAGVAEGRFLAGMTLEYSARSAIDKGSPVAIARPEPGAIGISSPIAVVAGNEERPARDFVEWVLTAEAQEAIAGTGWRPVREDVAWDRSGGLVVPDWTQVFDRRRELLDTYAVVFGG
ncbi:MAG: extracellular solute-binding protein [Actinobacteria bacterium]|nr:extracellular solute-binding protein [Actinomycetota bacterium]